ncbi:hypothetical protein MPR_1347 [Myroides profundi]|nr:hypothetical protein MPR_1347 [Myroides profundi]
MNSKENLKIALAIFSGITIVMKAIIDRHDDQNNKIEKQ